MVVGCEECGRLWRELANATGAAIRIDNKLKIAAIQRDYEKVTILTLETETAFAVRDQAREMIRLHEVAEHG
jgi:hypothetical protein